MRLIDAELLEKQAKERAGNEWNQRVAPTSWAHAEESFLRRVEDAPTVDAVPVVRCMHCRSYNKPRLGYCEVNLVHNSPDDFCSWGREKPNTQGGVDNAVD